LLVSLDFDQKCAVGKKGKMRVKSLLELRIKFLPAFLAEDIRFKMWIQEKGNDLGEF
jgi:hypothetical protein